MIRELSYQKVGKSPQAIAQWLLQQHKNAKFAQPVWPLTHGVRINFGKVGLTLQDKNRKEFAGAAKILYKKGFMMFIINFVECLILRHKGIDLSHDLPYKPKNKKLGFLDVYTVFKKFGITSGGKNAFYALIKKLNAYNSGKKFYSIGAVYIEGKLPIIIAPHNYIPYPDETSLDFEKHPAQKQEKVKKVSEIKIPKVKIKIQKTLLKVKSKDDLTKSIKLGNNASELKSSVCNKIGADIKNSFDGNKKKAVAFVNSSLAAWAESSTDSEGSLYLQTAMASLAKIKPQYIKPFLDWQKGKVKHIGSKGYFYDGGSYKYKGYEDDAEHDSDPTKALVQHKLLAVAIYKRTQEFLKNKGIKRLILYRGMEKSTTFKGAVKAIQKTLLKMNPLSSFSTSFDTAAGFGNQLIACVVPINRIFSCPTTGHGCMDETEFVVIGGKLKGFLVDCRDLQDILENKTDNSKNQKEYDKLESKIEILENKLHNEENKDTDNYDKIDKLEAEIHELEERKQELDDEDNEEDEGESDYPLVEFFLKKKLLGKHYEGASTMEPEEETHIYVDEGDNADWTKQHLDQHPLIGTKAFEEYVARSGKTVEQILAMPAYKLAHIKFAPVVSWLQRMAVTIDPEKARVRVKPIDLSMPQGSTARHYLCHTATMEAIKTRGNTKDKIWFFGDNDGKHPQVFHSMLTDHNNHVVANNYQGVGISHEQFHPAEGYKTPGGDFLPILDVVSVGEFFKRFFRL